MYSGKVQIFFALGVLSIVRVISISVNDFYPYGSDVGDVDFPKNDDGSSPVVQISSLFPFFNKQYNSLYVNTNGVISFEQQIAQFTPNPFPLGDGRRIIAPFWADVDIRNGGTIWYRESTNLALLTRATDEIKLYYPSQIHFHATWVFIATWESVAFYGASNAGKTKRNTFQAVLITNGRHSFTVFYYDAIQWTTGTASGGDSELGLGGTPAQVGFNGGDGVNYHALNQSQTAAIIGLPSLSNVGVPGKFVFRIDTEQIEQGGCNTQGTLTITPRYIPMFGGELITVAGPCISENDAVRIEFGTNGFRACVRRSEFSAHCSTHIFYKTGDVDVKFTLMNSKQETTTFKGLITLLNPLHKPPTLARVNPLSWKQNAIVKIDWKEEDIPFDVANAHLDIYTVKINANSLPYFHLHKSVPLTKTFVLDIDDTGAVLRLSKINQVQLKESVWSDVFYVKPENNQTIAEMCIQWQNKENQLLPVHDLDVQECPCVLDQAAIDIVRFREDPNCHVLTTSVSDRNRHHINCMNHLAATTCFRLNVAGPRDTGRLCCYNTNGALMEAGSSEGGGTLHRYHYEGGTGNIPYLSHFQMDVVPYLQCCVYGNPSTCNQYLGLRPKGDCQRYEPIRIGQNGGDPHFTTLDGLEYTFNGVGEFILLKHTNDTFMVQVRMEQMKDVHGTLRPASVITSFAAKSLNSSDTVEVQLNTIRTADVLINGNVVDFTGFDKLDFTGIHVSRSDENGTEGSFSKLDVVFKKPQISFRITAYSNFMNILILTGAENLTGNIDGLMGNNNGIAGDDLRTSTGSSIPANSTTETIHREVGLIWRVKESESLFTYSSGRSHSSYQNEAFTPTFDVLVEPSTEALEVCGNDAFCLYDFQTSGGDRRIAVATRTTTEILKEMNRAAAVRSCGFPPVVQNGRWNSTGIIENSTATLECYAGFVSTSFEVIICNRSGNWTHFTFHKCEPKVKICGDPEDILNGYWNATGTTENSTAILVCDNGYVSNTTEILLCNSAGNWTRTGPASCEARSCGFPSDIQNGYWNTTGTTVNSTAIVVCNDGYILNRSKTIVCKNDGNWTYTGSEKCERKVILCGIPRAVDNGFWNTTGTTETSTAVLVCSQGYKSNTSKTFLCNNVGNWTYNGSEGCEVVSCGVPRDIKHGYWNVTGTVVNSTAVILCDDGYTKNTTDVIQCNSVGNWTYTGYAVCQPIVISCGIPRAVANGFWNTTGTTENSTAVLLCSEGYKSNTTGIILCNNEGNWTYNGSEGCEVLSCGFPRNIDHGYWNMTGTIVNSTAVMMCVEGYTTNTTDSILCNNDGNWTYPGYTLCQRIVVLCGIPKAVENGFWNTTGTIENSTAILLCSEGYKSNTTGIILCDNEGNWTYNGSESCEVLSCGVPPAIDHGYWNKTGTVVNSTAAMMCDDGYATNTTAINLCSSDGNWTYTGYAVCQRIVSCGTPRAVKNGFWNTTGTNENSTATLLCSEGYKSNTTDIVLCNNEGNWTYNGSEGCEVLSCGFPGNIEHGYWNMTGTVVNSTAVMMCDDGYTANTTDIILCNSDGNWTDTAYVVCQRIVISCGIPRAIRNGFWNTTGTSENSTAVLVCSEGYKSNTTGIIICNNEGNWTYSGFEVCEVRLCGFPRNIENGYWNMSGTVVNSTAVMMCDDGYTTNVTQIIQCNSDGNWTDTGYAVCQRIVISCGIPRALENGFWNTTGITENSTAVLVCSEGYKSNSTGIILCNNEGNWTYNGPEVCEVLSCGAPHDIENGYWNMTGTVVNSTAVKMCDDGYTTNKTEIIQCNSDGNWAYSGYTVCERKEVSCGIPRAVGNGFWNTSRTTENSTAVLVCSEGYKSNATGSVLCNNEGNWTYNGSEGCEVLSCGVPRDIEHGYWNMTGTTVNSTAVMICDDGYTTNTTDIILCNSDGNWTYTGYSVCERKVMSCGIPRAIGNGFWNATGTTENSSAVLVCSEGYKSNTTGIILCNNKGNWTYNGSEGCRVLSCGAPRKIRHGYWNMTGTVVNSTAVMMCDDGYMTNTTDINIICNKDGKWAYTGYTSCDPKAKTTASEGLTLREMAIGISVCSSGILLVLFLGYVFLKRTNGTKNFRV